MQRIFITVSFKNGINRDEAEKLCSLVRQAGFEDFYFNRDIEKYQAIFTPSELMKKTLEEINKSDYLLIDMTDKPTGRAIEAGIAYSLDKKVIVIMKRGAQIKDTVKGIAAEIIEYDVIDEIIEPLSRLTDKLQA
jgi:nucleoside 2-deoxyribosyltransferase